MEVIADVSIDPLASFLLFVIALSLVAGLPMIWFSIDMIRLALEEIARKMK